MAIYRPAVNYWQQRNKVSWETAEIQSGDITRYVNSTGTIQPVLSVSIGSFVSGPIVELNVDFNDEVQQRTPPHWPDRRTGFQRTGYDRDCRNPGKHHRHADPDVVLDRGHLAVGRWRRHHEHHAGVDHRADSEEYFDLEDPTAPRTRPPAEPTPDDVNLDQDVQFERIDNDQDGTMSDEEIDEILDGPPARRSLIDYLKAPFSLR